MFDDHHQALGPAALNLFSTDEAAQYGIGRVILRCTSAVRRTVQVGAGAIEETGTTIQAVFAHHFALCIGKLLIEGGSQRGFGAIETGIHGYQVNLILGDTVADHIRSANGQTLRVCFAVDVRQVQACGGVTANKGDKGKRGYSADLIAAVCHQLNDFLSAHVVEQDIPVFIIKGTAAHHHSGEDVAPVAGVHVIDLNTGGCIVVHTLFILFLVVERGLQLVRGGQLNG